MAERYDAIIIGAGHNGLTCGAYLARAGLKTLVLERRHVAGGAAVTEEVVPGFKFSVFSYLMSLLHPKVIADLELLGKAVKLEFRDLRADRDIPFDQFLELVVHRVPNSRAARSFLGAFLGQEGFEGRPDIFLALDQDGLEIGRVEPAEHVEHR